MIDDLFPETKTKWVKGEKRHPRDRTLDKFVYARRSPNATRNAIALTAAGALAGTAIERIRGKHRKKKESKK